MSAQDSPRSAARNSRAKGVILPPISNQQSAISNSPDGLIPLTALDPPSHLDLATVRERLAGSRGREYWRSLEELADTPEFRAYLEREFPLQAPRDYTPLSRREFLRVMGAGLALAGVGGCAYQPPEKIVPYVQQPENIVPGKPLFFTTAFQRGGYAVGLLAESHMGRPTKLEGNGDHPASRGATDTFTQASLLGLYDPDRSQSVRYLGDITTWDSFLSQVSLQMEQVRRNQGEGLRILLETVTSPTLASQLRKLLARYPKAMVHQHEPVSRDNVREGARLAFGEEVHPVYHFDQAQRVLSLDANFFIDEPGNVRYARDFTDGRRARAARPEMSRLYVVESTPTITGAYADHHLRLRPSQIEAVARAIAGSVGVAGAVGLPSGGTGSLPASGRAGGEVGGDAQGVPAGWIEAVVKDLKSYRGASLIIAGLYQPPIVHALAHAMNAALGNVGKTVTYTAPIDGSFGDLHSSSGANGGGVPAEPAGAYPRSSTGGRPFGSLATLAADMNARRVQTLVVLGGNPAYTAPADLKLVDAMQNVALRIHLGSYDDETGIQCHWHIPESHYLEAWGDARAFDGTVSIVQPLIRPLYASRSAHELMAVLLGEGDRDGYDIVREYWKNRLGSTDFDRNWHGMLAKGFLAGSAAPAKTVTIRSGSGLWALGSEPQSQSPEPRAQSRSAASLEVIFRPDPTIWDGRFANNGWLQELPKPLTSLTWENAALVSPATARSQNLATGDEVELKLGGQSVSAPVWIMPGHPEGAVTLYLGYGRRNAGKLGTAAGFDAYALRTSEALWSAQGLTMNKTGRHVKLANLQRYMDMKHRDLVREGTLEAFQKNPREPEFFPHEEHEHPSIFGEYWPSDRRKDSGDKVGTWPATGYNDRPIPAWGMVIDLTACIGCGACVVACQAENNIPTVGKDQVMMHREMHWIRVDTYYRGSPDAPEAVFQPVPCMHCEKAPCEPVCPVEATTHSAEGINEQTYNRCIGTRYCSNNCPYKVRRFNYLQYSQQQTPTIELMSNPDVTVRSRGVMEKCTYCVQRVNEARIEAEKEDRPIADGDVLTACQQVCPAGAIIFGNLNDTESNGGKGSLVRQLKQEPLDYTLLTELNTRPRTSYLAKLRNLNPDLSAGS